MLNPEPIRVLHVVTYMGRGGLETMIMNYYRHIDRSKVQFDFLVHRDSRADYDDEIEELGGRIFRLPRLNPFSNSYRRQLQKFFKEHTEYRIVHSHLNCMSSIPLKAAKKCNVQRRIAHGHSSNQDKNLKYLIKLFYKHQIPNYATQLFACGKDAGDWMFAGAPYYILNNAIDVKKYTMDSARRMVIRNELSIPEGTFVVGHVGRFSAVKNHTFLLDVFAEVKHLNPNSILLLVGDGDLRAEMENKAASLGIADSVIFAGVRKDVPDLMQAMDCFVFPSHYEGLGIVAVEAQAAGLPCIVSDSVPDECVKTDLVKYVSLSESSAQWAKEILDVKHIRRRDTREEIAQAGYAIEANAQWLQNYYLEQWKEA